MRDLKLRAWIKDAKMCYEESGMYYQNDQYLSSFIRRIYDQYVITHPTYLGFELEERLMQYIGLTDKNGAEIYEGDIVKVSWMRDPWLVEYRNGEYVLHPNDGTLYKVYVARLFEDDRSMEVLGNIHENPELLVK